MSSAFNLRTTRLNLEAQRSQTAKDLRFERLEELYVLFDKWQANFSNVYLLHLRCYRGKLPYKDALDSVTNLDLLKSGDAQRMSMLIAVHFPVLEKAYSLVQDERKAIVPFLGDPTVTRLSGDSFVAAQVAFEKASDAYKAEIAQLAKVHLA